MRHEPSGLDADVVLGSLPFERETVARAVWVEVSGVLVPLPRPEDLVVLKAVATGPRTWPTSRPSLRPSHGSISGRCGVGFRSFPSFSRCRKFSATWKRYSLNVANGEDKTVYGQALGLVSPRQPPLSSATKGEAQRCSSNWGS